ncbi:unnamed protein product [Dicrocoelium dendriticum]|nr:unnamed protein product [Dicrocoelium dendriticum]
MAALGSRNEKFASIFRRVESLLNKGAMSPDERPLWYDVYKAFPPKVEPVYNRPLPSGPVREILYHEDQHRAEALRRYHRLDGLNLFKVVDDRSTLARFACMVCNNHFSRVLAKCNELKKKRPELDKEQFWATVESELQSEGARFPRHCFRLPLSAPSSFWFSGESVEVDGRLVVPEQVLKPPVRGQQIAIMGDSCDSSSLCRLMASLCKEGKISDNVLDVLVHEATLGQNMAEDARKKGHSTPTDVTRLAACLNVRLLILTHFSQRYAAIDHTKGSQPQSDFGDEPVGSKKPTGSKAKEKPSLQELLDEAKGVPFDGEIILADDLALVQVPPVPHE